MKLIKKKDNEVSFDTYTHIAYTTNKYIYIYIYIYIYRTVEEGYF